jgi:hypothetical protein
MAESDGKPASSPLSSDEADRLSERFKPSWESEPEPPTVPKMDPPVQAEPAATVAPAVKVEPMVKIEPAKVEPVKVEPVKIEPAKIEPVVKVDPVVRLEPVKAEPTIPVGAAPAEAAKAVNPLAKQTMLGIAPTVSASPLPSAPPGQATDLDWELPTNPVPSTLEETQPLEPPPKSNPSGVGQKYEPKDADAPAIVLTDEVKRAEEQARAQLVAEHKARSAPTVLKFKAVEVAPKTVPVDDELDFRPPKRGAGVWIGLGAGLVALALIGVALVGRDEKTAPQTAPVEVKAAPPLPEPPPPLPPPPTAETAKDEPPPPREPPEDAPAVTPVEAAEPRPPAAKPVLAPKPAPAPKPVTAAPKTQPAQPKAPPASKPTSPATKPASKPAAGGIVRDAPF